MTLPSDINTREMQKFEDIAPGQTAVRVTGTNFSGTFTPSGLTIGGDNVDAFPVPDSAWVSVTVPIANINQINVQNESNIDVKVRFSDIPGYAGITIAAGSERQYAIKDTIVLYFKAAPLSGGTVLNFEVIS